MTDEKKERLKQISIHAAQEGCDKKLIKMQALAYNFNPRSPRGLRLAGGDTSKDSIIISIHAAQEGCDVPNGRQKQEQ